MARIRTTSDFSGWLRDSPRGSGKCWDLNWCDKAGMEQETVMNERRRFMKSAMGVGAGAAMGAMAVSAATGDRTAAKGGIRLGNLYFSSGLTGVRPEARRDPLA